MKLRLQFFLLIALVVVYIGAAQAKTPDLKFNADGTFKILCISDVHYNEDGNPMTDSLIKMLIDTEKPDLIIVNGDNHSGNISKVEDLKHTISYLTDILEESGTPWATTFGNHDPEAADKCGITKAELMSFYEACPHNLNSGWNRNISGVGNKNILIYDSKGISPAFNVWLFDSFSDSPVPGAKYEWIHIDQVYWYYKTSKDLEAINGKKIPGFMFFHIPLVEIKQLIGTKIVGLRHENECPSYVSSGLYGAILDRGDVLGMFHGHDHQNNYIGKLNGIMMGYVAVAGYNPYPRIPADDPSNNYIRGGRVFLIDEADPAGFKTWVRFADGSKNWESEAYMKYNKL